MFSAIGLPEFIIIAVIALLIFGARRLPALGRSLGASLAGHRDAANADSILVVDAIATPDPRYALGVQAGTLSELFGLGTTGIRWRQVVIVVVGTWVSGNVDTLQQPGFSPSGTDLLLMTLWPVVFVFAAITAIRSFQNGLAVAIGTGALHSLLFTSVRFALLQSEFTTPGAGEWVRGAIASVAWPLLDMLALEFASSGRWRWIRMVGGLFVAAVSDAYVNSVLYGSAGSWTQPFRWRLRRLR